jgi:cell division protein ZapA
MLQPPSSDANARNRVSLRIFGEEYPLKSSADPGHLARLAEYVDGIMVKIGGQGSRLSANRVAVLAALQIADELFRLRQEYDGLTRVFEDEWAKRKRQG